MAERRVVSSHGVSDVSRGSLSPDIHSLPDIPRFRSGAGLRRHRKAGLYEYCHSSYGTGVQVPKGWLTYMLSETTERWISLRRILRIPRRLTVNPSCSCAIEVRRPTLNILSTASSGRSFAIGSHAMTDGREAPIRVTGVCTSPPGKSYRRLVLMDQKRKLVISLPSSARS